MINNSIDSLGTSISGGDGSGGCSEYNGLQQ